MQSSSGLLGTPALNLLNMHVRICIELRKCSGMHASHLRICHIGLLAVFPDGFGVLPPNALKPPGAPANAPKPPCC